MLIVLTAAAILGGAITFIALSTFGVIIALAGASIGGSVSVLLVVAALALRDAYSGRTSFRQSMKSSRSKLLRRHSTKS